MLASVHNYPQVYFEIGYSDIQYELYYIMIHKIRKFLSWILCIIGRHLHLQVGKKINRKCKLFGGEGIPIGERDQLSQV